MIEIFGTVYYSSNTGYRGETAREYTEVVGVLSSQAVLWKTTI